MRVLAFDTCSPAPAAALFTGPGEAEGSIRPGTTILPLAPGAGESLAAAASSLLGPAGLSPRDLSAVAVLTGPGSFTGLRAGLAFARGLARAAGVPLLGIGTFEAASRSLAEPPDADFVLDAGRGEVHRARRRGGVLAEDERPVPRAGAESESRAGGLPLFDLGSGLQPGAPSLVLALAGAVASAAPAVRELAGPLAVGAPLRYGRPSAAEERFGVPAGGLPGTGLS
jgi:tRNA threonylcarbamoyladenosine biosynthesis protein TsaB